MNVFHDRVSELHEIEKCSLICAVLCCVVPSEGACYTSRTLAETANVDCDEFASAQNSQKLDKDTSRVRSDCNTEDDSLVWQISRFGHSAVKCRAKKFYSLSAYRALSGDRVRPCSKLPNSLWCRVRETLDSSDGTTQTPLDKDLLIECRQIHSE
jgi:hypothetical protein